MSPGEGLAVHFHGGARLPGGDDVEFADQLMRTTSLGRIATGARVSTIRARSTSLHGKSRHRLSFHRAAGRRSWRRHWREAIRRTRFARICSRDGQGRRKAHQIPRRLPSLRLLPKSIYFEISKLRRTDDDSRLTPTDCDPTSGIGPLRRDVSVPGLRRLQGRRLSAQLSKCGRTRGRRSRVC